MPVSHGFFLAVSHARFDDVKSKSLGSWIYYGRGRTDNKEHFQLFLYNTTTYIIVHQIARVLLQNRYLRERHLKSIAV
jgi:hypothetical protein